MLDSLFYSSADGEDQNECESASFEKLKYISTRSSSKSYLDDYEAGVIPDKILIEIQLQLDPFKTTSTRSSTQFLDFLGDIGGFYQALDLVIFMAAEYFSAKFFLASIASTLYHQKIPQPATLQNKRGSPPEN